MKQNFREGYANPGSFEAYEIEAYFGSDGEMLPSLTAIFLKRRKIACDCGRWALYGLDPASSTPLGKHLPAAITTYFNP